MSKCRECGAVIRWMTNDETGKKMPVDALDVPFIESSDGLFRAVIDGEIIRGNIVGDACEDGYELANPVHWDTCTGKQSE